MRSHGICQRRRNDGHHGYRVLRHGAFLNAACADIIQQQHAHLVAGNQLIAAVRAAHGDAHTVGVRVGGEHQVGINLFGELQPVFQRLENLGVGVRAGGEVSVRIFLLGDDRDVGDAHVMQDVRHRDEAGSVERGVDQLQSGGLCKARAHLPCLNGLIESLFAVIADEADQALFHAFCKGDAFCTCQHIRLLDFTVDNGGCVIGHLAAVRPVGLVAVVFCRVVGSRYHDARIAVIIPCRKRKGGNRHQGIVDSYFDSVGSQHACRLFGKDIAFQPAVVGDGHRLAAALGQNPVGKPLGRLAHHPDIHAVCACTERSAQSGRSELQGNRKAVFDLILVVLDFQQLRQKIGILQVMGQPAFVFFSDHRCSPFLKCVLVFCKIIILWFPLLHKLFCEPFTAKKRKF